MRSLTAVVLLFACATPRAAELAAPELGIAVSPLDRQHEQAAQMAALGLRWVRTDLAWAHVESRPGVYDFSDWEERVDAYRAQRIRVLLILDYGNPLYDGGLPPETEAGRAAFAAFAGAAARNFRGRVAWEIWNEPNVPTFWAGAPNPEAYVHLARGAAAAIRREDPAALIFGPALGGGGFDLPYLEATFRMGLLQFVDGVSVHPYGAGQPEEALGFYEDVRRLIRQLGRGRNPPVVVTEWGYPVAEVGAESQADYLKRAIELNRQAGIPLTIWFNWQDPIVPWQSFGLLDVRGRPRPAYAALQAAAPR